MKTRQATKWISILLTLQALITACSSTVPPLPLLTPDPAIPTTPPTLVSSSSFSTSVPTATQPACLRQQGRVEQGKLDSTDPLQEYRIYLPPCYDEQTDKRYPVLYLLHGQTYTDDQWIRLGAVVALNKSIHAGTSAPFIIVFPDDRYWNVPAGASFGDRLVNALIPYVDQTYRTLPDRDHRAIGGMSRGAGWSLRLGLSRWDLFSVIGLHSLAVFKGDDTRIKKWLQAIPPSSYPSVYMDIGDNDQELEEAQQIESLFTQYGLTHEWHLYSGAHTETYWHEHVGEYIQWYADQWNIP